MKKQNGITLIALIITIVVLLIIAVVTIGAVQESGIIDHAQNAKTAYNDKKLQEEKAVEEYETLIEESIGAGTAIGKATVGVKVTKNSTIDGKAYSSKNPIIPAGFAPINVTTEGEESSWTSESGPEVDKGLVIEDEQGNQFVWVPVTIDIEVNGYGLGTDGYREPDVVTGVRPSDTVDSASGTRFDAVQLNLERAGCTVDLNEDGTVNAYDFKIQLTNEYKTMAESVNKYDGFYVGRFETSRNGSYPQSKASTEENEIITAYYSSTDTENDWYGLYALNKNYTSSSVTGSMIWGAQYNAIMKWMGSDVNITISDYNKERTCGTAQNDVINNVYDLYGNSIEYNLMAKGDCDRGYNGFNDKFIPNSWLSVTATEGNSVLGSRIALCVVI